MTVPIPDSPFILTTEDGVRLTTEDGVLLTTELASDPSPTPEPSCTTPDTA